MGQKTRPAEPKCAAGAWGRVSALAEGDRPTLQICKDVPQSQGSHPSRCGNLICTGDAPTHLRGNKVHAVPKTGPEAGGYGWFRNLGGKDSGGVDFPAIQEWLVDHKYNRWITLDLDELMLEGKDMEDTLKINLNYLVNVLHVPRNMV